MKLYFWALLVALGHAENGGVVYLAADKYFDDVRRPLSPLDVADAVARTFYLGYLNPEAQTDFLKLPIDAPSQNLLLTVTGLDGVDLSALPNLQGLGGEAPLDKGTEAPQMSFGALRDLAASVGARTVGLTDGPAPPASVDSILKDEFWASLVSSETLTRPGMLTLVQELERLRNARFALTSDRGSTFYFGDVRAMSDIDKADKADAARVLNEVIGQTLRKLPGAMVQIFAVQCPLMSAQFKPLTAVPQRIPNTGRKLLTDPEPTPKPTSAPIEAITIETIAVTQIKYWTIVVLAIVAYSGFYYVAFYGDYSADQMLYTSFNARWDERKRD